MRRRKDLAALLASGLLGVTAALGVAACGNGGRENVDRSNQGPQTAEGPGPSTVETGPTRITPTTKTAPGITQTQP